MRRLQDPRLLVPDRSPLWPETPDPIIPVSESTVPAHRGLLPLLPVSESASPAHRGLLPLPSVSESAVPAHRGLLPLPSVSESAVPAHRSLLALPSVSKPAVPAHHSLLALPSVSKPAVPAHHSLPPQPFPIERPAWGFLSQARRSLRGGSLRLAEDNCSADWGGSCSFGRNNDHLQLRPNLAVATMWL